MALDPQIALMAKNPQIESPIDLQTKALTLQSLGQQVQAGAIENQQRQRELKAQQDIDAAYRDSLTTDPTSGTVTLDKDKFLKTVGQSHGSKVAPMLKSFAELDKAQAEAKDTQGKVVDQEADRAGAAASSARTGKTADGAPIYDVNGIRAILLHNASTSSDPTTKQGASQALAAFDAAPDDKKQDIANVLGQKLEGASFKQQAANSAALTAGARATTADIAARKFNAEYPKLVAEGDVAVRTSASSVLGAAATQADYKRLYGQLPYDVATKFPTPDQWTPASAQQIRQLGMTPAQQSTAQHERTLEQQGQQHVAISWADLQERMRHNQQLEEGSTLSPEAVDKAADYLATTGNLPPLGMGASAAKMRSQIMDIAAKKYADVNWASAGATFKADQGSLGAMQKQRDAVGAFEDTALKNVKVFEDAAQKVIDTGSPWINKPLRAIDEKVLGSGDQAAFNVARRTVVPEFAKILNNPNLGGQLSDSARHEVDTILAPDATLKQIYDAIAVLKKDTANRRGSYDSAIANIKQRIATPPASAPGAVTPPTGSPNPPPPPPKAGVTVNSPSGQPFTFKDQASADAFVADAKAKGLWK